MITLELALYTVEQGDGCTFTVYFHGNGPRPPQIVGTFNTPAAAAQFLRALLDERL